MRLPATIMAALLASLPVQGADRPPEAQAQQSHEDYRRGIEQEVERSRQDLRLRQDVLHPNELREGERRMDAIRERTRTDPRAADDMRRILDADRSLSTINRPIPGGQPTPGLVGPGERP
jgi:hypothetical protein